MTSIDESLVGSAAGNGTSATDALRRWLMVLGLIGGPVLAVLSVAIGLGPEPDSMRASFDVMAERGSAILVQDLLETAGFAVLLAALFAAAQSVRGRGGVLATVGAILGVGGMVGFGLANGAGLAIVGLAQRPDRDAAFVAASAISDSGPLAAASTVGWALEIVGLFGVLIILCAFWRARLVPPWPALLALIGIVANAALGTMLATLAADVLLLAAGTWTAIRLARAPAATEREAFAS